MAACLSVLILFCLRFVLLIWFGLLLWGLVGLFICDLVRIACLFDLFILVGGVVRVVVLLFIILLILVLFCLFVGYLFCFVDYCLWLVFGVWFCFFILVAWLVCLFSRRDGCCVCFGGSGVCVFVVLMIYCVAVCVGLFGFCGLINFLVCLI